MRYVLEAAPRELVVCECDDCRRATGALRVGWLLVPLGTLRFLRGTPASREPAPGVTRVFCRGCGTQLAYRHEAADHVRVSVASLDDPAPWVAPSA